MKIEELNIYRAHIGAAVNPLDVLNGFKVAADLVGLAKADEIAKSLALLGGLSREELLGRLMLSWHSEDAMAPAFDLLNKLSKESILTCIAANLLCRSGARFFNLAAIRSLCGGVRVLSGLPVPDPLTELAPQQPAADGDETIRRLDMPDLGSRCSV